MAGHTGVLGGAVGSLATGTPFPLAAAIIPGLLGGIGGLFAGRGGGDAGQLSLENVLAQIMGQPLAGDFDVERLAAPGVRLAQAGARQQRQRIGQFATGRGLGGAQTARLLQGAERGLASNLLQTGLRAANIKAQAGFQERLGRNRMLFQASLTAEELARQRQEQAGGLGQLLAGTGAQFGLGLAGGIQGQQEQNLTLQLLQQLLGQQAA